jgi:hypothetical protein
LTLPFTFLPFCFLTLWPGRSCLLIAVAGIALVVGVVSVR